MLKSTPMSLISQMENLDVPVDSRAVVVMNEKTGTIVMGENVRIATVAVAHGNLSIQIKEDVRVLNPFHMHLSLLKEKRPSKIAKTGRLLPQGGRLL